MRELKLVLGPDLVKLIAEIDEFKGRWEALKILSPDRLNALRKTEVELVQIVKGTDWKGVRFDLKSPPQARNYPVERGIYPNLAAIPRQRIVG